MVPATQYPLHAITLPMNAAGAVVTQVSADSLLDMPASAIQELPVQTLVVSLDGSGDMSYGYMVHQVSSRASSCAGLPLALPLFVLPCLSQSFSQGSVDSAYTIQSCDSVVRLLWDGQRQVIGPMQESITY